MKTLSLAASFLLAASLLAGQGGPTAAGGNNSTVHQQQVIDMINAIAAVELSEQQVADLLYMYEEEKMAHDLYTQMAALWEVTAFERIAASEATHMASVTILLEKYSIALPATAESEGVFDSAEIQSLYDSLLAQGSLSVADALEMGRAVELADIADLEAKLVDAPVDVTMVYGHLLRGSERHLTAFENLLTMVDEEGNLVLPERPMDGTGEKGPRPGKGPKVTGTTVLPSTQS